MERVSTLIKKLQKQLDEKASAQMLLHTVQMLQAELQSQTVTKKEVSQNKAAVIMPVAYSTFRQEISAGNFSTAVSEEKVIEVLQVDEKAIEEELEQIKKNAELVNSMGTHARPAYVYDPVEDVPTLAHQTPLEKPSSAKNEIPFEYPESLNDRLKEVKIELSEKLTEAPIKDLRKAIGVNDRFLFINELFRGDEAMYERSIKTIQNFSIFAEAEFWIRRELKVKIGWHDNHPVVKQFDQLIRRRFS
ncbi:hypothetical protein FW778_10380 [Ginsengibacter hankyongi]|uniref:Uncharacterized protein n=1 Tax=Ginsengibacter hankyongi TaxID=2607284 RepID=A0A5J5IG32_9BACT|nr:hypothetical protein [Ginsengibacter hankyongi]KAA9039230.1 hypothetical protein FW778_10380 [Ginsengibacter hankyongi]